MTVQHGGDAVLLGCTMVVAAERRSGDLASALARHGARVLRAPPLSIRPNADDEQLLEMTRMIIERPPDVVVATTGVGFRGWMDAAHENGLADDLFGALRCARFVARGPKAHGAIQQAGFTADWVARSETAAEVGDHLVKFGIAGARVVVQHHGGGDTAWTGWSPPTVARHWASPCTAAGRRRTRSWWHAPSSRPPRAAPTP
ncbi:uroporphyrinogen-III synthase [Microbacterium sp. NPDC057650]|uniref:uroporphyrinogen-III synthase n=1 Tax=unclassified Microbacterium TaxID=2609290 RepID=UPI003672C3C0